MTKSFDVISAEELRNLSGSQRANRFTAYMLRRSPSTPPELTDETRWRPVDRELTLDQYLRIPAALPGDNRTLELWLKFRQFGSRDCVVAKGFFDHDGAVWTARLGSTEHNNCIRVTPTAWAEIL